MKKALPDTTSTSPPTITLYSRSHEDIHYDGAGCICICLCLSEPCRVLLVRRV